MTTVFLIAVIVLIVAALAIAFNARGENKQAPSMPLGDFVLGPEPAVVARVPDTGRTEFGPDSVLRLRFKLHSENYFGRNDGDPAEGHFGFMLRADLSAVETGLYRGHGVIFGSLWSGSPAPNGMRSMISCCAMETWQNGATPEGYQHVKPQTVSTPLDDEITYPCEIVSSFRAGKPFLQFTVGDYQSPEVADDNTHIDPASQALALFAYNPGGGVVHITELTAQWGSNHG